VKQERTQSLALHRVLIVAAVSPLLPEAHRLTHVSRHQHHALLVNTCLDQFVCNAQLVATKTQHLLLAHPALFVHPVSQRALLAAQRSLRVQFAPLAMQVQ